MRLTSKRNQSLGSSLPSGKTRFRKLEIVILKNNDNSEQLVLGTKVMNCLITSPIRVHIDEAPTIGASSCSGYRATKNMQIYLLQTVLQGLMDWIGKQIVLSTTSTQQLLHPYDEHVELRELRSKFDRLSTYLCCRSSSEAAYSTGDDLDV